ncbi:MAG: hypothetical protein ACLPKE_20195 [Streptosporangiaceae bacterium]
MNTPADDHALLHELELTVSTELTMAQTSSAEDEAAGVPIGEQLLDPDAERYEVRLRSLLGAVQAAERGARPGGDR